MAPIYITVDPDAVICGDTTGHLDCELDFYESDKDTARLDRDFHVLGAKVGGAVVGAGLVVLAGWQLYVHWDAVLAQCQRGVDWVRNFGSSTGHYDLGCVGSFCQKNDDLR